MLAKLKQWWKVDRHVRALHSGNHVVLRADEYADFRDYVSDFVFWANASGSLHDGTTPNHTKKMILHHYDMMANFLPDPVEG